MSFTAFVGPPGSGKTASLTYVAFKDCMLQHRRIISNYKLKFPRRKLIQSHLEKNLACCPPGGYKPEPLKLEDLLSVRSNDFKNALSAVDEIWTLLDSRSAGTKANKKGTTVVLQMRKRDMDLVYTTQWFKQVDVRIRVITDYVIKCERDKKSERIKWTIHNRNTGKVRQKIINPIPIYPYYDTKEIIDPTDFLEKSKTIR